MVKSYETKGGEKITMWSIVYAVDPAMDASVATALTGTVQGLQDTATGQLTAILPLAAVVLVSVAGIYFAIRFFRRVAHI